jgi:hypothetical protein
MNFELSQTLLIMLSLLAGGVIIFSVAIRNKASLSGKEVLDISGEKFGIGFKSDAFGLMILSGIAMIGMGLFLIYQNYETKIVNNQEDIKRLQGKISALENETAIKAKMLDDLANRLEIAINDVTGSLKTYRLHLNLVFPQGSQANPFTAKVKSAIKRQDGSDSGKVFNDADFESGPGGIIVKFENLHEGDRVSVLVEDDGKTWRSFDMSVPNADLNMRRITQ